MKMDLFSPKNYKRIVARESLLQRWSGVMSWYALRRGDVKNGIVTKSSDDYYRSCKQLH
eukprot:COSAG06_NODE_36659_length_444_cov_1.055072_1_plen_58_part_01